ncbi:hypothetical protein F66182_16910 [Fusarium sp. NRRL 66182]|nr:hypothetical protein F66182_16910 [Fusarium sp. NRRL 66182]
MYHTTPHMTFVGSALYDVAQYPENITDDIFTYYCTKSHVKVMNQYNLSKLLLLYAVIKLSSSVDDSIVINSLDPCFCKTGLGGESSGSAKFARAIFAFLFARTAEEGSRLIVKAASMGRESHGGYMRAGELQAYAPIITSAEGVQRSEHVWEALCSKLEGLQPGVLANVTAV